MIMHWASDYSSKVLRRCILLGYRCFSGPRFYYEGFSEDLGFTKFLSPKSRQVFEQGLKLHQGECDTVEAIFRAVLERDEAGFHKSLARLHPGEPARLTCLIHLCKFAQRMADGKDQAYVPHFTAGEVERLWKHFTPLDEALKADTEQNTPGFQIPGPTRYRLYELPHAFGIDEFVAGWNGR